MLSCKEVFAEPCNSHHIASEEPMCQLLFLWQLGALALIFQFKVNLLWETEIENQLLRYLRQDT